MSDSSHSEADTRIILHVFSCVHNGLKGIYVRTNDTDVVVILVAYMSDLLGIYSNVRVSVCLELDLALVAYLRMLCCIYRTGKVQRIVVFALSFRLWLYFKFFSRRKSEIIGCMANKFSCFRNISAIWQSSNVTIRRAKFESNWIICSFIICSQSDISSSVDIARYQIFKYRGNSEIQSVPPAPDALI